MKQFSNFPEREYKFPENIPLFSITFIPITNFPDNKYKNSRRKIQ